MNKASVNSVYICFHLWTPMAMPTKSSYCIVATPFISRSRTRNESVNLLSWTQQTMNLSSVIWRLLEQALFLCAPFLLKKEKCSPFLELTPTLWQMPRDVTNISEDWADICQCQEFWCHFLSFIFSENGTFSFGRASQSQKGHFYEKMKMIPKLLNCQNLQKATGNICDRLWHLLRCG